MLRVYILTLRSYIQTTVCKCLFLQVKKVSIIEPVKEKPVPLARSVSQQVSRSGHWGQLVIFLKPNR